MDAYLGPENSHHLVASKMCRYITQNNKTYSWRNVVNSMATLILAFGIMFLTVAVMEQPNEALRFILILAGFLFIGISLLLLAEKSKHRLS
jgi:Na+/melibiose symporter-like transporter